MDEVPNSALRAPVHEALDKTITLVSSLSMRNVSKRKVEPKRVGESRAADGFAALGNRARLRLLRLLVRAGPDGLNVGDIGRLMKMPASTLAHHLTALVRAGLVTQERRGREVICTADYAAIKSVAAYLMEECCAGVDLSITRPDAA